MDFDISQFDERKEIVVTKDYKDINDMNLDKLSDALCQITSVRKMNEESRAILIEILRNLKKYTDEISYEFIAYLIYTAKHPHAKGVNLLNRYGLWDDVKKEMNRVKIALKRFDPEYTIESHINIYRMFKGNKVFFRKAITTREYRFINSKKL